MKRNIAQITTKNRDFRIPRFNSMWYMLYVYGDWNLIDIKRIPDPEEYNITKI